MIKVVGFPFTDPQSSPTYDVRVLQGLLTMHQESATTVVTSLYGCTRSKSGSNYKIHLRVLRWINNQGI